MKESIFDRFSHVPYFTINGYRQIANPINAHAYRARVELNRAVEKGSIVRLQKGVYTTRAFYLDHRNDPEFTNAISSVIFSNSYVSLESILQRAGILTETTPITTAITTEGNRVIENSIGTFSYRHLKADLYHSYEVRSYFGIQYAEATLSKALFDFFYLKPIANVIRSKDYDLVEDLRLNLGDFPKEYQELFHELCIRSGVSKMKNISDFLSRELW
jgi:predicted transcriptional regulator of viral defense system